MKNKIKKGNLNSEFKKNIKTRGWFIGSFLDKSSLLSNNDLEIKWGVHKKGELYDKIRAVKHSKSLSILIRGKIGIDFPDLNKKIILKKEGDYLYWSEKTFHTSKILEDSLVLTIRWPSLKDNLIEKEIVQIKN
jgi:hypothetical protein